MHNESCDRHLKLSEAAEVAGYSVRTAHDLVRGEWAEFSGKLGKEWRVSASGLNAWLALRLAKPNEKAEAA